MSTFDEYLSQPCDEDGCEQAATHDGTSKSGVGGRWCNQHLDRDSWAQARND